MKVRLAGYNLDAEVIESLKTGKKPTADLTPETISAANARISRDPRPIHELRAESVEEVERARASNRRIVFGFGHTSVAEHAVLNFDILDATRLGIESIESHRLASYTEKSQRYIRLGEDFLVPNEITNSMLRRQFTERVASNFALYQELVKALEDIGRESKLAGEDARYACPLATTGQVGMTINARELEHMIRRLSGHPLLEISDFAKQLYNISNKLIPSLVRYTEPRGYDKARIPCFVDTPLEERTHFDGQEVSLVKSTSDPDTHLAAILLQQQSLGRLDYETCLIKAGAMDYESKCNLVARTLDGMSMHDVAPREFEHAQFTFEVVSSAAAFSHWKRHRMSTITPYAYDLGLDLTVPPYVETAGKKERLVEEAEKNAELYNKLNNIYGRNVAEYALLNAHRRRFLITASARELYLISRLREDLAAQWDIRNLAGQMIAIVKDIAPITFELACGKDRFDEVFREYFKA